MRNWRRTLVATVAALGLAASAGAQTNTTIYDIQQGMFTAGDLVVVDSVVVIGIDVKPSTYGVYIQEQAGGPYSGLLAFNSGIFPAYVNSGDAVQEGDLITVTGNYTEFSGLTEMTNPTFEKIGTVTPLAPEVLAIDDLSLNAADGGEQWEGVLVQVQQVRVISLDGFNNWKFVGYGGGASGDSLIGWEKMIEPQVVPLVGDSLVSVTGVADFAFNERRISPRGNNDIVFASGGPPPAPVFAWSPAANQIRAQFSVRLNQTEAEDTANYSLNTFDPITSVSYDDVNRRITVTTSVDLTPSTTPHILSMSNVSSATGVAMVGTQTVSLIGGISTIPFTQTPISAMNDTSQVANNTVTVSGVVTGAADGNDFFPSAGGFYVQDRSASAFGGLFVFGPPLMPSRGDSVTVSGSLVEFGTGPSTQITDVREIQIHGPTTEITGPLVSLADATGTDNTAEQYEAMLIRFSNVEVITSASFTGDPFDVTDAGGDTLRIDDLAIDEGSLRMNFNGRTGYLASPYDIMNVEGIMTASGTAPFQRLQPRNWNEPADGGDIELLQTTSDTRSPRFRTALEQNQPNPFNPTTRIHFTIGSAGRASLRIFDLRGRLVATLFDEHRTAGPAQVVWDGRDLSGRQTPSGVYWYRLITASGDDRSRKMVLLK